MAIVHMGHWYTQAIIALILMGTQSFLYKVSAARNCNSAWTTFSFMAISYLFSTLFCIGLRNKLQHEHLHANYKEALAIGFSMGLINFIGYYTFLKALSMGPLSIVISIIGLHFVIAILLSVPIYKEKLTPSIIAGISLTILSVILLGH